MNSINMSLCKSWCHSTYTILRTCHICGLRNMNSWHLVAKCMHCFYQKTMFHLSSTHWLCLAWPCIKNFHIRLLFKFSQNKNDQKKITNLIKLETWALIKLIKAENTIEFKHQQKHQQLKNRTSISYISSPVSSYKVAMCIY